MSVLISDEDYKEYRTLQDHAIREHKLNSIRGMNNLKHDVDAPIRRLVAMFALLGCEPLWSCCGFDYEGQPIHKTHEYGNSFVVLRDTERSQALVEALKSTGRVVDRTDETDKWETWQVQHQNLYLRTDFDYFHEKSGYPWTMKSCIHFPELAIIRIDEMERLLMCFRDQFADEVTLQDTNGKYKRRLYNWQYPALEDWVIKKDDVILNTITTSL